MTTANQQIIPPVFRSIVCAIQVDAPIERVWKRVGDFSDAGRFLDVSCKVISGDGGPGTVRQIGESILEVMAGCTDHSYTYGQIVGPMAEFDYHGCLSLTTWGETGCMLTWTLIYDEARMDEAQRAAQHARISARFLGAVQAMKTYAADTVSQD
jgi:hypothetical protein